MTGVRVGVDVGGTFTKAVALSHSPVELCAHAVVPTTHSAEAGVADGVASALRLLFAELAERGGEVELVAFSTTQAMNALLEGDVARVGVIGIGSAPELRQARKRTRVGDIKLAPKRVLHTEHAFLDATGGLSAAVVDRTIDSLQAAGCTAIAVSGAFAVDAPEQERFVAERARERGLPVCAGHELTGTYGLETRTVSAAINASILPVVERTATVVERVLADESVDVPLLVLRGDGGAMSIDAFRRAPRSPPPQAGRARRRPRPRRGRAWRRGTRARCAGSASARASRRRSASACAPAAGRARRRCRSRPRAPRRPRAGRSSPGSWRTRRARRRIGRGRAPRAAGAARRRRRWPRRLPTRAWSARRHARAAPPGAR